MIYEIKKKSNKGKMLGAAAAGAAGTVLLMNLGTGDAPTPENSQPAVKTPEAATQIIRMPKPMATDSISVASAPQVECSTGAAPGEQEQLFAVAREMLDKASRHTNDNAYLFLRNVVFSLTAKKDISKENIALIPDEVFTQLRTTKMRFTADYQREALVHAEKTLVDLFDYEAKPDGFYSNAELYERIRLAKSGLSDSIYAPDVAAKTIIVDGEPLSMGKINALEEKYKTVMLDTQRERFNNVLGTLPEKTLKDTYRRVGELMAETYEFLDDGHASRKELDEAFQRSTGRDRSELEAQMRKHDPDSPYLKLDAIKKQATLDAAPLANPACWRDVIRQSSLPRQR